MNFKENIFLIAFLPIVLLLYYILPKKARWGVLLASSLIFYILSSGIFTFIMLGTSVTIYVAGLLMQKINDNFKKQKSIEGITKEEKKLLKRVRGGAEAIEEVDAILPMDFQEVFNANKEDKIIIAKKAASLIQDNDVIFIDSGSTCFYMIDYIKAKEITVVTKKLI